jgi:hypothetical protein
MVTALTPGNSSMFIVLSELYYPSLIFALQLFQFLSQSLIITTYLGLVVFNSLNSTSKAG